MVPRTETGNRNQRQEPETVTDLFAAPGIIPSTFPSIESFRGRLVLIKPKSQKQVPNNLGNPGDMKDQITADVTVVDGLGPVNLFKQRQFTGQTLPGPDFPGVWLDAQVVVVQLQDALRAQGMVLGRIDTKTPGTMAVKGNPWGIIAPTEEDKQTARNFLATRTVAAAAAPAPAPAPVAQPAPVYAPQPVVAAAPVAPPAPVQLPTPGSAPAGVNPFA